MFVLRSLKLPLGAALALALCAGLVACGSTSKGGGTVTVLMGTAPDSLDPALGASTQSGEATWLAYTGLVTYAHASGEAGTKLIPGVAESMPAVSKDGLTYTFKLRKDLAYSNGLTLKAADFAHSIERTIKLGWGGKGMLLQFIEGAEAFDKGKASSISGIRAEEASGTITIKLTAPFGPFLNLLAFPATALLPSSTPDKPLSDSPPPGVGPYEIVNVVPNRSFELVRNPNWTAHAIPGIPSGSADIRVSVSSNPQTEAEQVLNGSADVFDSGDTVPPTLLSRVQQQAAGRYALQPLASSEFFFLNVKEKPFSSQLVREAVNYAIDRRAIERLDSGMLQPACFLLPTAIPGHPSGKCPYGDPAAAPDVSKARELVSQAGASGAKVTVWGPTGPPHKEFADYYASVLNSIGLKATVKIVADAQYPATIGNLSTKAQTGWLAFSQDFPHPADFYQLLDAHSIQPQENHNLSQVSDPHIQAEIEALGAVPTSKLGGVTGRWQKLDEYTASKAYMAVIGYDEAPQFTSSRVDFSAAIFHPVYGNDWSSLKLK